VLKQKKPSKRSSVGGASSSRKSNSIDLLMSSDRTEVTDLERYFSEVGSATGVSSPIVSSYDSPGGGASSGDAASGSSRGNKWGSSMKASLLAGFHLSRWGRSSSTGSDRPSPSTVMNDISSSIEVQ